MKLSDLGESGFLERLRDWTSTRPPVLVGIGDDAAVLDVGGESDLVVSTDAYVENVHFRTDTLEPADVGHRAMAGALSDLAAMGAKGIAAFVALHAPPDTPIDFLRSLYRGLARAAEPYGVQVAGGDTVRGPLALDVTAVGTVPRGRALLRSGARDTDVVFVSGPLGRSEAGRLLLFGETAADVSASSRRDAEAAHRAPRPRFDVAELVMGLAAPPTAMIDVSDGLGIDLGRLCEASGAGCRVDAARIPVDEAAQRIAAAEGREPEALALGGGEDYELVFTVPADGVEDLEAAARSAGLVLFRIGEITPRDAGTSLIRPDGRAVELPRSGWDHFRPA